MKSLFFGILFTLSLISGVNANITTGVEDTVIKEQKSCVSIAAGIANGDSKLFKAAYVGCIEGRL
ncbi:MAG: hypothetical protein VX798_05595 [Bacteroidota bacterium]|uniref:Uncharacterized protein n=1 Tax=Flagellimonas profundi TaxID=2915620 RepID=A0ABS3FH73_9FLAO|nr:hypothetical protein [Allomuricauda profundi]MBO0341906.1 hypothetical protein [Allomuricauda profundi]MEC7770637.1 hypothetical protein [Bacteroidota bacterium]